MEANNSKAVIELHGDAIKDVAINNGIAKGYCSFREFYGRIIKQSQDIGCDTFIDEGIYFKALVKLGIVTKGRIVKDEFIHDKNGTYLPANEDIALKLYNKAKASDNEFESLSYFMTKRGTFGFNCESPDIQDLVTEPVLALLCKYNTEMEQVYEEAEKMNNYLKEAGSSLRISTREQKQRVLNKFFN